MLLICSNTKKKVLSYRKLNLPLLGGIKSGLGIVDRIVSKSFTVDLYK